MQHFIPHLPQTLCSERLAIKHHLLHSLALFLQIFGQVHPKDAAVAVTHDQYHRMRADPPLLGVIFFGNSEDLPSDLNCR